MVLNKIVIVLNKIVNRHQPNHHGSKQNQHRSFVFVILF